MWVLLAGGASAMATSGCLWNDDVNQLPRVKIEGPGSVHIGETAEFKAELADGKTGMMFEWGRTPSCPENLDMARRIPREKFGQRVTWTIDPDWPATNKVAYCTFVIATDDRGAAGYQKHPVALVDRQLLLSVPAQVTSGMPAKYTARFSDDPAAAARAEFFWGSSSAGMSAEESCAAAQSSAEENQRSLVVRGAEWESSSASRKPYCVVVIAKDNFGEVRRAEQTVSNIINGGPPASPRVVSPKDAMVSPKEALVGIFTSVRVAAAEMGELGPSDVITFNWTVKRPDGTALPATGCEGAVPPNSEICFDVADGGNYTVNVEAKEGLLARSGDLNLKVEDRPPCIRMTEPTVPDSGATTVFSLDGEEKVLRVEQVVDDGDPMPPVGRASQGVFVWTFRKVEEGKEMTTPFGVLPNSLKSYALPAGQYRLGDKVDVRVEYRDRLHIQDLKARDVSHCGAYDLACETRPKSNCFLRVGWRVLFL